MINAMYKKGIKIKDGDKSDLKYIYELLSIRFQDQKKKVKKLDNWNYLSDLYDEFYGKNMKIFMAEYNENLIGGVVLLYFSNIVYFWIGVPKSDLKGISANEIIYWESIKWAYNNGFLYLDQMDGGDNRRLRRFKSKFNPDLYPYHMMIKNKSTIYKSAKYLAKKMK